MLYLWAREYPALDAAEEANISLRSNRYISAVVRSLYSQSATDSNNFGGSRCGRLILMSVVQAQSQARQETNGIVYVVINPSCRPTNMEKKCISKLI